MISINLAFSLDEAKQFFETAGLEVKRAKIPVVFPRAAGKTEMLNMWTVANPNSGTLEQLDVAFLRCVVKNRVGLIADISKVEIYNSFK